MARILQKPLKCRNAHCGAMCCPAQVETCNGEPTKCFYYERRDDLYVPKSISIERIKQAIQEMDDLANHKIKPISFDQSIAIEMCINIIKRLIIESEGVNADKTNI